MTYFLTRAQYLAAACLLSAVLGLTFILLAVGLGRIL